MLWKSQSRPRSEAGGAGGRLRHWAGGGLVSRWVFALGCQHRGTAACFAAAPGPSRPASGGCFSYDQSNDSTQPEQDICGHSVTARSWPVVAGRGDSMEVGSQSLAHASSNAICANPLLCRSHFITVRQPPHRQITPLPHQPHDLPQYRVPMPLQLHRRQCGTCQGRQPVGNLQDPLLDQRGR